MSTTTASTTSSSSSSTKKKAIKKKITKPAAEKPVAAQAPPRECTPDEYTALLSDASSLTKEAARLELLDCARYGEVDAVRAILEKCSSAADPSSSSSPSSVPLIDHQEPSSGNTALHMACANGHATTVSLLLSAGAQHLPNDNGNTPLHWAAANGHAEVVRLLLDEPRLQRRQKEDQEGQRRDAGSNAKEGRERTPKEKQATNEEVGGGSMDVLQKNAFGRSALTEGFANGSTDVIRLLLEHDSANEDRLLSGGKEIEPDNDSESNKGVSSEGDAGVTLTDADAGSVSSSSTARTCVVHEFDFRRAALPSEDADDKEEKRFAGDDEEERASSSIVVKIRELPIAHADDPFGSSAIDDTTGLGIWAASLVMSRWVSSPDICHRLLQKEKSVLELGAGCGVPGLAAALYGSAGRVVLTDFNPDTVENLRYNVDLNADSGGEGNEGTQKEQQVAPWCDRVTASSIDWGNPSTYPSHKFDVVLGSDLIYQRTIVPLLLKVVSGLLKPNGGKFLYVAPESGRDGLPEFIERMTCEGGEFELISATPAPEEYKVNPLRSGDDEECFLHFHELAMTNYILYEFRRRL